MNLHRHEFFRTVSDSCLSVTFISGSENHKSHGNFSFRFCMSVKLFLWLWGIVFWNFQKIITKKQCDEVYGCYALGLRSWDIFGANFQEFPKQIISRATVSDCFRAFIFYLNLSIVHFSCSNPFNAYSCFVKNLLISKHSLCQFCR